jgi:hypothetical protein
MLGYAFASSQPMAKGVAIVVAAVFAFASLMGLWFHIAAGSSAGPGLAIAIVAGAVALIAGVAGAWLASGEPN